MISLWGVVGKLSAVLFIMVGPLLLLKKLRGSKLKSNRNLIEVMATHYLDPKKRLSIVRVSGRSLLLGITGDSIRLLTEVEVNSEFADAFDAEDTMPSAFSSGYSSISFDQSKSIRNRIKSRLEGLKEL